MKDFNELKVGNILMKQLGEQSTMPVVHRDYMGAPIQISVYDDELIVWNEVVYLMI